MVRRRIARVEPEPVHAEGGDVVQVRGDAVQVSDAVTVGVREGPDVQLVDDAVTPPECVCHADPKVMLSRSPVQETARTRAGRSERLRIVGLLTDEDGHPKMRGGKLSGGMIAGGGGRDVEEPGRRGGGGAAG